MDEKMGERLLAYRKSLGLTQEQLAEKVFVTRQAVSKWERGESVPDLELLVALAELYGVTLDELVLGKRGGEAVGEETTAAVDTEAFRKSRRKRLLVRMATVFLFSVGVWGLLCGIVHSACMSVLPNIWIVWFTLPVVPPLAVLAAFSHYIPSEWRAYFVLVPFISGAVYLVVHYTSGGGASAAWLAFLLIPFYYIPAAAYTARVIYLRRRGRTKASPAEKTEDERKE